MSEATLTVSPPEPLRRHVENRLEALLLAGLDSGKALPPDWAGLRRRAHQLAEEDESSR